MSQYDLVLRNGTVVSENTVGLSDIAIVGGQIAAIGPGLAGRASREINARNLHIFPGVIDAHVHFNEPGRTAWEGFASGTSALAAGGTTSFFDMPLNAHPPTVDAASFDLKLAAARASSLLDFAFWGGIIPGNLDQLDELAERGVIGFKAFMSNSGIDDFPAVNDLELYEGMERAARLHKIVAVHAESEQITHALACRAIAAGRTGVRDFLASRPVLAELEAIERALLFAKETGCSLHIVHVSTARGAVLVASARARGLDVSCETCPHYLILTEEDMEALGAIAKCAPPLRPPSEQAALWGQLLAGNLPMIASDHSPAPARMKESDNFFEVWGGISGCQSLLPLLLTEAHKKRQLPLIEIVALTSTYVARRFRLPPRKGHLVVGADADLSLIDLRQQYELQAADLHYRHPHSPYLGRTLHARVVRTLLRGTTVFLNGKIVARPNGQLLKSDPDSHP